MEKDVEKVGKAGEEEETSRRADEAEDAGLRSALPLEPATATTSIETPPSAPAPSLGAPPAPVAAADPRSWYRQAVDNAQAHPYLWASYAVSGGTSVAPAPKDGGVGLCAHRSVATRDPPRQSCWAGWPCTAPCRCDAPRRSWWRRTRRRSRCKRCAQVRTPFLALPCPAFVALPCPAFLALPCPNPFPCVTSRLVRGARVHTQPDGRQQQPSRARRLRRSSWHASVNSSRVCSSLEAPRPPSLRNE